MAEKKTDEGKRHRLPVVFYRTAAGREVVLEWLRELPRDDRRAIGLDLLRVQENWPLGMPLCESLGGGLHEVRTDLPSRRIARLLFREGRIFTLHGFIKKTQKTATADLELGKKRLKEVQDHERKEASKRGRHAR